jgi:hypothetical protein
MLILGVLYITMDANLNALVSPSNVETGKPGVATFEGWLQRAGILFNISIKSVPVAECLYSTTAQQQFLLSADLEAFRKQKVTELWSYRAGSCSDEDARQRVSAARGMRMSNSSELALGAIGQKESPYIEEWVLYHLFIGVDMIYVYDNEEEPTYHAMFECNPRVHVMHYPWSARSHPDRGVQISATMDFVELVRGRHKWVMFPDMDDFLVALDYPDIKQYLRLHMKTGVDAIAFQWWVYTQSQQAYKADRPSMDRFNYRERRLDRRIKTLYDVNAVVTQVCTDNRQWCAS